MKNPRNIGIILIFVCAPLALIAMFIKDQNLPLYFGLNAVIAPLFVVALVCIIVAYIKQKRKESSD